MNISIIEWGVYGFVGYLSLAVLITSVTKEVPGGKLSSLARAIFMIPGIICNGILTYSGVDITLQNSTVGNIIKNLNNTDTWQETATTTNTVILQNPVWVTVHFMFMMTLIVFFIIQLVTMFTAKDKSGNVPN